MGEDLENTMVFSIIISNNDLFWTKEQVIINNDLMQHNEPIVLDVCTWKNLPTKQMNIQQEPQNMEMFMEDTDEEMVNASMQAEEKCTVAKYLHIAVTDVEWPWQVIL